MRWLFLLTFAAFGCTATKRDDATKNPESRFVRYERSVPGDARLHFAETVSVARRPDGECDWGMIRITEGRPGSASSLDVRDDSTCTGVVYNATYPNNMPLVRAERSAPLVSPDLDRARLIERLRELILWHNPDMERFKHVTVRGDSAWVTSWHADTTGYTYVLEKRGGTWELASRRDARR